MEMGSGSLAESGGSSSASPPISSSESLNGLKFGQKIYFEDAGTGAPTKQGGGTGSSSSGSTPPKKVRSGGGGVLQGGQTPRCQVEGCKVDLSDAKAYYSRHKVCSMHSKSPKVIVAGIEQRFCQQCSRFHLLPEFDQGKRSCRRRLAGHNERRRKPPPGSLLSSRYGRLSSSFFGNNSRGGFLMDFSAYPKFTGRDAWPTTRSEQVSGNQTTTSTGKFLPHPWQSNTENPTSDLYLQGSVTGMGYPGPGIPPGECFTGVTDSSCALSLLSNQTWGSRSQESGPIMKDLMNAERAPVAQPTAPHGAVVNQFPSCSWGVKGNEVGSSSDEMPPDLGLSQISQPFNGQFSGELESSQQSRRQYVVELGHSGAYSSSPQQLHWSL